MHTAAQHISHVRGTIDAGSAATRSRLAASWNRSMLKHRLDPAASHQMVRLAQSELRVRRDRSGRLLSVAQTHLDRLASMLNASGCGVMLADQSGIILAQRVGTGDIAQFQDWGLCAGGDWSEANEGTNGIGTCLAEMRPIVVHRREHFLARNIDMSCIDAPIFGPEGQLVGALNVSSARADQTRCMNSLISETVLNFGRQIEGALFRAAFPGARIVEVNQSDGPCLLAVDMDDLVLGATRSARRQLGLDNTGAIAPQPAADLLGQQRERAGIEGAECSALRRAFARTGGNASATARALGISRATLYRRMKRLGMAEPPRQVSRT